jgi:drug/metabolite transporter (DMT)-like permease
LIVASAKKIVRISCDGKQTKEVTLNSYWGELAGLGTSVCWTGSSVSFTISSRLIGANVVNRFRLALALVLLMLVHFFIYHRLLPTNGAGSHWFWFGLSGIIGFAIGDSLLFRSLVLIGPRLTMLLMSLSPVFGTISAWIIFHQALRVTEIIAIAVTLGGVSAVILERPNGERTRGHYVDGVLCGLGAAVCQALGLVVSKIGLAGNFPALSGNIIRVLVATVILWMIPLFRWTIPADFKKLKNTKASLTMILGAVFGPFLGVWLSLVSIQWSYIGIASTLQSLSPILLIPVSHWVFREKISSKALVGTVVAIIGVAMIFLFK